MKIFRKISLLFLITVSTGALVYLINGVGKISEEREVIFIENYDSQANVIESLDEKGLIKNRATYFVLKTWAFFKGPFEPGGYVIPKNLNFLALANSLTDPQYKYVSIADGMRKEEIAEQMGKVLQWDPKKIAEFKNENPICPLSGKEGYLAAGNYLIKKDTEIQTIHEVMEKKFQENVEKILINNGENILNFDQIITIASLIQREAAGKKDMRLISGIIWNRLFIGMPLQIDATLQYAKGDGEKWWPIVNSRDKEIDSPYNTYKNEGLPPGPIASPGISAIEAAMNPAKTDCIFYLHDKLRNIHCSDTYKGHLENINRYLK
jgi:UPF0755 protein